jgi:hypothetical protein
VPWAHTHPPWLRLTLSAHLPLHTRLWCVIAGLPSPGGIVSKNTRHAPLKKKKKTQPTPADGNRLTFRLHAGTCIGSTPNSRVPLSPGPAAQQILPPLEQQLLATAGRLSPQAGPQWDPFGRTDHPWDSDCCVTGPLLVAGSLLGKPSKDRSRHVLATFHLLALASTPSKSNLSSTPLPHPAPLVSAWCSRSRETCLQSRRL